MHTKHLNFHRPIGYLRKSLAEGGISLLFVELFPGSSALSRSNVTV